ncbi:restriction endonuclease [Pectobacterium versatile]|uniref:type II restriction endonuclease n=1 Tax=Pectobacterium versatile TaxID=2488639 RepID=UPI001CE0B766|nr:type II restriction endonuclease [Pectobacterium versatile]MCA5933088.1 restriction endonuclease [Pectobacterium versatile]MCA5949285.1 restriction endonuclease [Pectobacterium versatile]MCA5953701.1 restriction endonuclease [Pectobacterium versatile]UCP88021.1 restriction endonuclease [Pectobacterium versatile]
MLEKLSNHFEVAVAKYLSAVDVDSKKSNQHEIGGLVKAGFARYLPVPKNGEKILFNANLIYISGEESDPVFYEDTLTWYDTRHNQKNRNPEYRMYYKTNPVSSMMNEGDFFLIIKKINGDLLIIITPSGSAIEFQLKNLFGINNISNEFSQSSIEGKSLILPVRMLFEDLGIELEESESKNDNLLEILLRRFPNGFPKSKEFSSLAWEQTPGEPLYEPDETLMLWLEQEEKLFRTYERFEVAKKLARGFGENGDNVDDFIDFSLSVQNRRKSRVGFAFENHLNYLFSLHGLKFQQGSSKNTTESKSKPDFLFPDFSAYHDPFFPQEKLRLLGAKTTCKDRWRQVLAEGDRIGRKHLITIQPGISEQQLTEMKNKSLQLVVPYSVQSVYPVSFISDLQSVVDFIAEIKNIQAMN